MARVINTIPHIIDDNSRILILGTMPGPESLAKGEYYANPRNRFWKIIYQVLAVSDEPPSNYDERIKFLTEKGIALWDVLQSCEREGAKDSKIKNGKPNDFRSLLDNYPNLRRIFFNGKTAAKCFEKYGCPKVVECIRLPSSSSANTRMTLDEKVVCWRVIKDFT
jgi:methylated-DNA-[protein]-cysteine S-methyltransferase